MVGTRQAGLTKSVVMGQEKLSVAAAAAVVDSQQELEVNILPVLSNNAPLPALHDLAKQYRRAAATAPTRPHGWFLGAAETGTGGGSREGVGGAAAGAAAATAAAVKKLLGRPAKAGVALVDAAADMARFGPGKVPSKA